MRTRDDVIKALGDLTRSDREWIIRKLPRASRFALLVETQQNDPQPKSPSSARNDELASYDPRALAGVFESEPAWVAHAMLSTSRSWAEEVRQSLSHSLKQQLDLLDRVSISYTPKMIECLEEQLAAALSKVDVREQRSGFQQLISQIGVRLSKARLRRSMAA